MHIQEILSESDFSSLDFKNTYKNLTPIQIGLLRKIKSGNFNYEIASPQNQNDIELLIDAGLVDSLTMDITDKGEEILNFVNKYGSWERYALSKAKRDSQEDKPMSSIDDFSEDYEIE